MITIFDVAKKAKVSVVTVSRLLNNPSIVSSRTAKKVFSVIEELNYQPSQIARSMVSKRTNTIGVIMPDIKNTFFNNWFRCIEEYAGNHNYNLVLCNTDEDWAKELKYIKLLQSQRVDGIIIVPSSNKSVDYLQKSRVNFILFDRIYNNTKTNYVTTNHYDGAYNATEYLIKLGHKRIAVLRGTGELFPDIERYAGFEAAMKKHKIPVSEELVINCEFKEEEAFNITPRLLKLNNKPTAIFSFNSLMTIGVIKAVQKLKLSIPKNISLLSFDEIPGQDIFTPRITHISQPVVNLGKDVMLALIEMIKHPKINKRKRDILKPKLIIGDSCRKITSA